MIRLSDPRVAAQIVTMHVAAAALLAQKAGCRPEEVVVKDTKVLAYPHLLEDPTGKHAVFIEVVVSGLGLEPHGPECGYIGIDQRCAPAAAIAPPGRQADGAGG